MLWLIFFVLLVVYGACLRWKWRKFRRIHEQLPVNIKAVPLLGHAVNCIGNARERMKGIQQLGKETVDNFDGITSVWLAYKLLVVVADPLAAEIIMKTCLEKDEVMDIAQQLIGYGSIFAPVSIWRPRRKILAPKFSQKTLNSFVECFSKNSSILMDQLKTSSGNGDFSIQDYIIKFSMDSVCETMLGVKINCQSIPEHPAPKAFRKFCNLSADRATKPWLYSNAIYRWHWNFPQYVASSDVLKQFVSKIIKSKRQSMNEENNKNKEQDKADLESPKMKSLLELLIESEFTDLELQEETLVMLVAGTDTTSVGSSFAAVLLARHPDIQEKVYKEIKEVIGESERHIQPDDLPKLKYLDAVIRETLRLYPPVPLISRRVEKDITLPSGVTLVPGVCVLIHIWAMHRNKRYWGADANVFRPERFLEGAVKHPYAYIPFSNGPRNCLGFHVSMMEMKTVMAYLIRRYQLLPSRAPDGTADGKELPVTFEVMMKDADNFQIQLEERN